MSFLDLPVGGHRLRAVLAPSDPARERRKALEALEHALPSPEEFSDAGATLTDLAATPDFHVGRPVPVGVVARVEGGVLPHLIGNDIGCGMRLSVLPGITAEDVRNARPLEGQLRHQLFQGGRDVAMTGRVRAAALREGMLGFVEALRVSTRTGMLDRLDLDAIETSLDRVESYGSLDAGGLDPDFASFCEGDLPTRDAILGSLGGGNHFLELGVVEEIFDGGFSEVVGLRRGDVMLCIHSGSLDFGHRAAATAAGIAREQGHRQILPWGSEAAVRYRMGLYNAANAAFLNRFILEQAAAEALRRSGLAIDAPRLCYETPHNMAWIVDGAAVHRKGSCPARSGEAMTGTPFAGLGEPVILPGSMGDATWLLRGLGSATTISSSAHGAGRRMSRTEARHLPDPGEGLRVVGPIDLEAPDLRGRRDILGEARRRFAEEAPAAYRPVSHVVQPMVEAGIASPVARITPLLTAKG